MPTPSFNKSTTTLLLNAKTPNSELFSLQNKAENLGLFQKEEFHITLIANDVGKIIQEKINNMNFENRKKAISDIEKLSQEFCWQYSPKKEYYFISKIYTDDDGEPEERKSIIQVVEVPEINLFYKKLNELLKTNFEIPFTHITLFTSSTKPENKFRGIGIYSEKHFKLLKPQIVK